MGSFRSFCRSVVLLLLVAAPAAAEPVRYSFSGNGASALLVGEFILDDAALWDVMQGADGSITGSLTSPLQSMSGTFGSYIFNGAPTLFLSDSPSSVPGSDYWIVRAPLTGPSVGGFQPMFLNLFVYTPTTYAGGLSLVPPPPTGNPFDFQFSFAVADASGRPTFETGTLTSLTRVPEPGVLSLLTWAGGAVGAASFVVRRKRVRQGEKAANRR